MIVFQVYYLEWKLDSWPIQKIRKVLFCRRLFVCLFVCLLVCLSFFFSSSVREGLTFFLKTSTDRDEIFRHGPDNIDHPTLLLNFMTVAKIRLLQVDPG